MNYYEDEIFTKRNIHIVNEARCRNAAKKPRFNAESPEVSLNPHRNSELLRAAQ